MVGRMGVGLWVVFSEELCGLLGLDLGAKILSMVKSEFGVPDIAVDEIGDCPPLEW